MLLRVLLLLLQMNEIKAAAECTNEITIAGWITANI